MAPFRRALFGALDAHFHSSTAQPSIIVRELEEIALKSTWPSPGERNGRRG